MTRGVLLAADGGATKVDVAVLRPDGRVLGAARGPACSFERQWERASVAALGETIARARRDAGVEGPADAAVLCLAGVDLPVDERRLLRALRALDVAGRMVVRNDTFAVLRAGTDRGWGVAIVCGTGINCTGVSPAGRVLRFPALGELSGDLGGGGWLGVAALRAAIRGRELRGPRTTLERSVPAHFGLRRPHALMQAVYTGRIDRHRLTELAPLVFAEAEAGDPAARAIADQLADEVAVMAGSAIRRLRMARRDPEVVLGGGVFRTSDRSFHERIDAGVHAVAPAATVHRVTGPPLVGAALLAVEQVQPVNGAARRLRATLTHARLNEGRR